MKMNLMKDSEGTLINKIYYRGIPLIVEYTIEESRLKPYQKYYYTTTVKVPNCNIDISEVLGEPCWIGIVDELRKINER